MVTDHDAKGQLRADAQVALLAATRAAKGMGDEFLLYLITMAIVHLETLENNVALRAPENA